MTATLEMIRAAIGNRMKTVAELGVVWPYERYAANEKDFQALYLWKPNPDEPAHEMRGWFIRRLSRREYEKSATYIRVGHDWQIAGYMALQDQRATELLMDNLVEQLCGAFRLDLTLGGLVEDRPAGQDAPSGLQLVDSGPYMLGGVLCHGVKLTLTTAHYEPSVTPDDKLADLRIIHANWELPPRALTGPDLPDDEDAAASDQLQNLDEA
jgi:hypothetical protein